MFSAAYRRLLLIILVLVTLVWILASTAFACLPASTALTSAQANAQVVHVKQIFSIYQGSTSQTTIFKGFMPAQTGSAVYPGVLRINPTWSNYVHAAQESPKVEYTLTNVTLKKDTPEVIFGNDHLLATHVTQSGDSNIRLVWPLLYELPGTNWTLTIDYTTPHLYDDDGSGPNAPSTQHTELWVYYLETDISHLSALLEMFHSAPLGTTGVPLFSNEALYPQMRQSVQEADEAWAAGDTATGAMYLADFELTVMDSVIVSAPTSPNPTGLGTGFIETAENRAASKLLTEVEYIFRSTG